jgi:DNA topoisomerase IB
MRIRRSDPAGPGYRRRRAGAGFTYVDPDGRRVIDRELRDHFAGLVISPAWVDVWICPYASGHIQAIGTDAAGRRQYLYHPQWRTQRDAVKHERALAMGRALPWARRVVGEHLQDRRPTPTTGPGRRFPRAGPGFLRIGSETYAEDHGTFGLATLRRDHIAVRGDTTSFSYPAKGAIGREQHVVDPTLVRLVRQLLRRASDESPELLAFRESAHIWRDVRSEDVDGYIREVMRGEFTAKDFRTWHATVLMAQALAVSGFAPPIEQARKKAVARAVAEVAWHLGSTPAVARASYIDSRVIDLYLDGITIDPSLVDTVSATETGLALHGPVERATVRLLSRPTRPRAADRADQARGPH